MRGAVFLLTLYYKPLYAFVLGYYSDITENLVNMINSKILKLDVQIPQFHHVFSGQLEGEVSSSCQVETARQNIWISFARGGTEDGDGIC